mmetsp:Transcript_4248/g.6977  ORF Transcript_4248/g.6977 Transcript_4248/m.6977 type:complete len:84 (-) Transcript_4248:1655-1906(-)
MCSVFVFLSKTVEPISAKSPQYRPKTQHEIDRISGNGSLKFCNKKGNICAKCGSSASIQPVDSAPSASMPDSRTSTSACWKQL